MSDQLKKLSKAGIGPILLNQCAIAGTDSHYGRRVEMDRSWTIYHVFTGVPAVVGGQSMTGLNRTDATNGMLRLNLRGTESRLSPPLGSAREYRL